ASAVTLWGVPTPPGGERGHPAEGFRALPRRARSPCVGSRPHPEASAVTSRGSRPPPEASAVDRLRGLLPLRGLLRSHRVLHAVVVALEHHAAAAVGGARAEQPAVLDLP